MNFRLSQIEGLYNKKISTKQRNSMERKSISEILFQQLKMVFNMTVRTYIKTHGLKKQKSTKVLNVQ